MNGQATLVCVFSLAGALFMGHVCGAEVAVQISQPYRLSPHAAPGDTHMGIRLLGSVVIARTSVDGLALGGLSGLAWDEDEARLYALSDRGVLFHLRPRFDNGLLAAVDALAAFPLRDHRGRALQGRHADAEALVLEGAENARSGDSVLTVSFERNPRILRFATDGRFLGSLELPVALRDVGRYAEANKALESLAWLPDVGLLTAPERPLQGADERTVALFALDGRHWRYQLTGAANASLVDMEALSDGSLLALERSHGLMFLPLITTLRHVHIDIDTPGSLASASTLAVLDSSRGWSVDNFEGLARFRGLSFFMVSDDNFNELQKTLLVHFSLESRGDDGISGNVPEFEPRQKTTD